MGAHGKSTAELKGVLKNKTAREEKHNKLIFVRDKRPEEEVWVDIIPHNPLEHKFRIASCDSTYKVYFFAYLEL